MSRQGWLTIVGLCFIVATALRAETIELNDGTKIVGTVAAETDTMITVKVKFGTIDYPKSEIKSRSAEGVAESPKTPAKTEVATKPELIQTAAKPEPKPVAPAPVKSAESAKPENPPDPPKLPKKERPVATAPEMSAPAPGTLAGSPSSSSGNAHDEVGPRDVLTMKDGSLQQGFYVSETATEVLFDIVMSGRKVAKTMLSRTSFKKDEIESIKKLTEDERAAALNDLKNAAKEAKLDASAEQNIRIEPATWPLKKDPTKLIPIKKVQLEHFTIESDVEDELLRKIAYRLDKVFKAYAQHFGVDRNQDVKVRVCIFNSMEEYYASVEDLTGGAKNPAFYMPALKLISAGCDVAKYEWQIKEIHSRFEQLNIQLKEWKMNLEQARADVRAQVSRAYDKINAGGKGATPAGQAAMENLKEQEREWQMEVGQKEKQVNAVQDEIYQINRRIDVAFTEVTQEMLATMYHEGFHAFLDNFLFTPEQSKLVPRWLNEGLAQYFEAARLENGRFILGQDVREKMVILKKFRNEGTLFTLDQLVNGGQSDYVVHEIANVQRSTKNYLQAWELTNLLGEKGRLKREILQAYVQELASNRPPLEALKVLSGTANDEIEKLLDQKLAPNFQAEPGK